MPAEFESGVFAQKPAWHKMGIVLDNQDHFTPEEGLRLCPQFASDLDVYPLVAQSPNGDLLQTSDLAIVRSYDQKVVGTGKAQLAQGICDGKRLLQILQSVLGQGQVKLESMGTLKDGSILWALAQLCDFEVAPGDRIKSYQFVGTGLNGNQSTVFGDTDVRVVCSNTYAMAMRDVTTKIKHTQNHEYRLLNAEKILAETFENMKKRNEEYKAMAERKLLSVESDHYFKTVLGVEKQIELKTRTQNTLDKIRELYEVGDDLSNKTIGTLWGAFNAITNYANHHSVIRGEFTDKEKTQYADDAGHKRMHNVFFGSGASLMNKAQQVAHNILQA